MRDIKELVQRHPRLDVCADALMRTVKEICALYARGGTLLVCGNGGSAADSEHIVGEMMKGFLRRRALTDEEQTALRAQGGEHGSYIAAHLQRAVPALSLVSSVSLATAFANDVAGDLIFAQQVHGIGRAGDILLGISTSGNARNVLYAFITARAKGIQTVLLTGADGGLIKHYADIAICVPADSTPEIQELHLPVYHYLCAAVEAHVFTGEQK